MPAGRPGFVRLADALRSASRTADSASQPVEPQRFAVQSVELDAQPVQGSESAPALLEEAAEALAGGTSDDHRVAQEQAAIRAATIFRAALADALEGALADLIRELAVEIVARELRLADVDIASIAQRLIAERQAEEPIRLRVAAADAAVACDLPVWVDSALLPGDAILECRSGSIDARLGVRLAAVLRSVSR